MVEDIAIGQVIKLATDMDLSYRSVEAAKLVLKDYDENLNSVILIVHEEDALEAGRVAQAHHIDRVISLPSWILKPEAWLLSNGLYAVGSPGA